MYTKCRTLPSKERNKLCNCSRLWTWNKWNLEHLYGTINKIKTKSSNTLRNYTSKTLLQWQMVITSEGVSTTYYAKKLDQGD
jgi:hypothetical protein